MTRRLLLSYLSITLLILLGLEVPFGVLYAGAELGRFTTAVERDTVMLTELAEEEIEEGNIAALPRLVGDYARRTGSHVTVVDRRGVVLSDSDSPGSRGTDLSVAADIAAALHNQPTVGTSSASDATGDILSVTRPASSGTLVRGAVRVTTPTTAVTDGVHHTWLILALIGLFVLAAVALIGFAIARWVTRPLRALERATTQLADGALADPPATDLGPPELRRLATAFTRTATRLQHLLRAQRSFAADASHQLKTPLTALRLRVENLEPDLHPRAHPGLDTALAEIDRLDRMIHGLLALARLEDGATTPTPVDLDAVVAERAEIWAAFAAEQQVDIVVAGSPVGPVLALPGALEQIIDNLLANALRVAPPTSTITLAHTLRPPGGHADAPDVELRVIDQGPGMTAVERRHACDRFWRGHAAPEDVTSNDGTGLGLTIVAQLVRSSSGEIALHAAPGGGLEVLIQLKSANRPATGGRIGRTHRAAAPQQRQPQHTAR